MKQQLIAVSFLVASTLATQAQQSIQSARSAPIGTIVTVQGVALNGAELGATRYIMDGTGAIVGYSATQFATINRGDSVKITGTTKDYKCLLELDPVTVVVKVNSGNILPTPTIIIPSAFNETYEAQLVRFNNVTFKKTGNFAGNTNYTVVGATSNDTALVRIATGTVLVGTPIPTGSVNIVALGSQFSNATTCTTGYQALLRDAADIIPNASIFLTTDVAQLNTATTSFDVNWTTNIAGASSYITWGADAGALSNTIVSNNATVHTASITGLQAGQIYYVKAYSINGTDTVKSQLKVFATESNSTGKVTCYFNKSVDNSVAFAGNNAIQLVNATADTISQYINRAKLTLDVAIYNWGTGPGSAITTAINAAYARGVKVRLILDGSTAQTASQTLTAGIKLAVSPQGVNYTIMHNKFIVADANSSNANDPIVLTGSTNWTTAMLNTDANSLIIVQDQALARNYKLEFDEMWGDTVQGGATNAVKAKYGQYKTDNTAHEFKINGKRVESYFSPSDGTNAKLVSTVNTTNSELYAAIFSFTKTDVANAIKNVNFNHPSAVEYAIYDDTVGSSASWTIVKPVLGTNAMKDNATGIFHHKYLIVDANDVANDPLLWVGSHNWSSSADTKNDENTLVIHDANVANQYYQEYIQRLKDNGVAPILTSINNGGTKLLAVMYPNPTNNVISVQLLNNQPATLTMYSTTGALAYTTTTSATTTTIDVSTWAKGMYVLQIIQGNTTTNSKLIVE